MPCNNIESFFMFPVVMQDPEAYLLFVLLHTKYLTNKHRLIINMVEA